MTPERWQQITNVFEAALERGAAERGAFLDAACGGDEELRREVEAMLASHEAAPDFMEAPAAAVASLPGGDGASLVGQAVAHYRVLSRLGSGGMGDVYLAEDTRLGRKVALKLLPEYLSGDERRARMFTREARAASALNHPNIVTVYDLGRWGGRYFIAMEHVEGETLGEKIHRDRAPLPALVEYLRQVAEGLTKAHAAGIVHRDLKPDNIMVTRDGAAKLLDFGLAKHVEPPGGAARGGPGLSEAATAMLAPQSLPGMVMGTAGYMSPEQAQGKIDEIDHRSDIFSFGCILYEAATGRRAFEGEDVLDTMHKVVHDPTPSVREASPHLPGDLERIVRRCLAKDREKRYQSVKDVAIELEEVLQELKGQPGPWQTTPHTPAGRARTTGAAADPLTTAAATTADAAARPTSSAEYLVAGVRKHKKWAALIAAAAVLAVLGGAAFLLPPGENRGSPEAAASRPSLSLETMRLTRLTTSGKSSDAAISPDGRYVAYNSIERVPGERAGAATASIWIRQVATGRNLMIVPPGQFILRGMTFSPDGNYLYYRTQQSGQPAWLNRVPVLGGDAQRLIENLFSPVSFSPDGRRIAFVRNHSPVVGNTNVIIANADGTGERVVATRKAGELFATPSRPTAPVWSPDGKVLACAVGRINDGTISLLEVQVEGGAERQIGTHAWANIDSHAWLPDGSGLVMTARDRSSPQSQIWHVAYPEGSARRVTNDLNEYQGMSLSADGKTMVVAQSARETDIWIIPGGGAGEGRAVTSGAGKADGNWGISWTPDGRVVYSSNASGNRDIWLLDPQTGAQKQLTSDAYQNFYPQVTPDGRSILFLSDRGEAFGLWRMDIDGANPRQLIASPVQRFAVSPDGQWIVYATQGSRGIPSLWRARVDGGEPVELNNEFWEEIPSFTPDGRQVLFQYFKVGSGRISLGLMPLEGGQITEVAEAPFRLGMSVRPTPDGRAVAYIDNRGEAGQIFAQPLSGGPPRRLTDFKSDFLYWFDWSRDGKQLALSRGTTITDVVLFSNLR